MTLLATIPRAPRYELRTRVIYRPEGEHDWREGQAVNVSRTGVLFQPEGAVPPTQSAIEFVLELPGAGLRRHARVECRGRVARSCGGLGCPGLIGATIDTYKFLDPGVATG